MGTWFSLHQTKQAYFRQLHLVGYVLLALSVFVALHWTISSFLTSFWNKRAPDQPPYSSSGLIITKGNTLTQSACRVSFNVVQYAIHIICDLFICHLCIHLASTTMLEYFSVRLLHSHVLMHGVILPQVRSFAILHVELHEVYVGSVLKVLVDCTCYYNWSSPKYSLWVQSK